MIFARLLALLQDGHTEISITGPGSGFGRFPFQLYYFGKELRVVLADSAHASLLGKRLTQIDGQDVEVVFEKLKPYMNADNELEYITTAPTLMGIPEVLEAIGVLKTKNSARFTVLDDQGTVSTLSLEFISLNTFNKTKFLRVYSSPPLYLQQIGVGYWKQFMPDAKVMYIHFQTLYDASGTLSIKKFAKECLAEIVATKPNKVVVDFRLCRGGNYFNVLPLIEELAKMEGINVKGRLFVINGRLTFSAAAVATVLFRDKTNAMIVGEVCRARPNWAENMESYELPNSHLEFDCLEQTKIQSPVLGKADRIPVDVEIPRSFVHYVQGRDEVMEYILGLK